MSLSRHRSAPDTTWHCQSVASSPPFLADCCLRTALCVRFVPPQMLLTHRCAASDRRELQTIRQKHSMAPFTVSAAGHQHDCVTLHPSHAWHCYIEPAGAGSMATAGSVPAFNALRARLLARVKAICEAACADWPQGAMLHSSARWQSWRLADCCRGFALLPAGLHTALIQCTQVACPVLHSCTHFGARTADWQHHSMFKRAPCWSVRRQSNA